MKRDIYKKYEYRDMSSISLKSKFDLLRDIDFSNISDKSIFYLCLENMDFINSIEEPIDFDNKELLKLLMKNDLEMHEEMLIIFQHHWHFMDKMFNPLTREKNKKEHLDTKINMAELFVLIRKNQSKKPSSLKIDITVKDGNSNHKIHFDSFRFYILMSKMLLPELKKEFLSFMSPMEAKECIINSVDSNWNFVAQKYYEKDELNLELTPPLVSKKVFYNYLYDHPKEVKTITNEMLENMLSSLKTKQQELNKPGARDKNSRKARLAIDLTYLCNFKSYWEQNEIKSIYDFPLTHDIYRFVYDYLNVWGLIEKKNITSDKALKANYAKALINNFKSKVDFEYNNKEFTKEYVIDMFHRIKYGEAEITEYLNYINDRDN